MIKRNLIFGVLFLVSNGLVAAGQMGTGRVTGSVEDPQGNPIVGAKVTATAGDRTLEATTDENGRWAILGFRSDTYEFTFTAEGYQPQAYNQQVRQTGRNPSMDVVLEPVEKGALSGGGSELLKEANALYEQQQYSEAISKYEEILAEQPTLYQIYFNIGSAYREMGENDQAVASFEKVLAEEPMNTAALVSVGEIRVEQGNLDEAVSYFEKAIDLTEDEVVPFNVAEIYFNQGNAQRAIEYYQIAAERKPDWPEPHLKLGYAYLNTGDMESAKAAFEKVVEVAPDTPQAQMAEAALSSLK